MVSVIDKISKAIKYRKRGSIFFSSDFVSKGSLASVNKALSELTKRGDIVRPIKGIDYDVDIRKDLRLTPPTQYLSVWKDDYSAMQEQMVHGTSLSFEELLARMEELSKRFK